MNEAKLFIKGGVTHRYVKYVKVDNKVDVGNVRWLGKDIELEEDSNSVGTINSDYDDSSE
jgi:hypothetical protein